MPIGSEQAGKVRILAPRGFSVPKRAPGGACTGASDDFTAGRFNGTPSTTGILLNVTFSVKPAPGTIRHIGADLVAMPGGTRTVKGHPSSEGDVPAAGRYDFEGTITCSGRETGDLDAGLRRTSASSAVRLSGALGFTAIDLFGLSHRRRR